MQWKIFEHSMLEDLKELFIFKPDSDRAITERVLLQGSVCGPAGLGRGLYKKQRVPVLKLGDGYVAIFHPMCLYLEISYY